MLRPAKWLQEKPYQALGTQASGGGGRPRLQLALAGFLCDPRGRLFPLLTQIFPSVKLVVEVWVVVGKAPNFMPGPVGMAAVAVAGVLFWFEG